MNVARPKVMTVVGTRPELIKLALVIEQLDRYTDHVLVHTGQNFDFELNEIFFRDLGIRKPDFFLNCAKSSPAETIASVLVEVDKLIVSEKPTAALIYGDTNSALAAIVFKKRQVPIFHMEAGNRCFDQRVPEEVNRKIVDHLSDVNLPLTEHARRLLLAEGLPAQRVIKSGSCMREVLERFAAPINDSAVLKTLGLQEKSYFVVSSHREENVDRPETLRELVSALTALHEEYKVPIIVSTHPRTSQRLEKIDLGRSSDGIRWLKPLGFHDYIRLQKSALCVLSDSGTITEEAAILKFPAVMIRDIHERPEGTEAGILIKAPVRLDAILHAVRTTLDQGVSPDIVEDYEFTNVSKNVLRVILSYIDIVNRTTYLRD